MEYKNCIWYRQQAKNWNEALPLGNGRMGAMVFGETDREHVQLNEDSVWYGTHINRNNKDSFANLAKVRRLIFEGKISEAEELCYYSFSGTPEFQRPYQTLGDLFLHFSHAKAETTGYIRKLDLNTAISSTEYQIGDTVYRREAFISVPDDVLVMRITADGSDKLNICCQLDRNRFIDHSYAVNNTTIAYDGNGGEGGISFCTMLTALHVNGTVQTLGDQIMIKNADEVLLLLTAATSFRYANPEFACVDILQKAKEKSFGQLLQAHLAEYQQYFSRVDVGFGGEEKNALPTDERMSAMKNGSQDNALIELYFNYGRYLLIASSRPGSLPANLQGIWCMDYLPCWDSKYTININAEMNYWPAEVCGLPEMHMPLFELIRRMVKNGQETAKTMYGCRGFVAHHNTDIYADTAPQDKCITATYWMMGGAWLCLHIWEHFDYTHDITFLKNNFDCMEQAVIFFEDFLIEDKKGHLVTCPSLSPENTYILSDGTQGHMTYGCAMDNEILYALFTDYLKACKVLNLHTEHIETVRNMLDKLPKPGIGKYGQLMEWIEDYEEVEPGHRHISQLFGMFPGTQFTREDTPELMNACETTLKRRLQYGGGHTGWSRAWIISLWARLKNGEKAYENIEALLTQSTFDNLFDNHPMRDGRGEFKVFQIDGNFGATAGIVEMLVQSYNDKLMLLPALPKAINTGYVKGLRIRGDAEIQLTWKESKLTECVILPKRSFETEIRYLDKSVKISLVQNQTVTLDGNLDLI